MNFDIDMLMHMAHSPRSNYIVPGLTSWLIGTPHPDKGCVRLFHCSRNHQENIVPHSHRFDFQCVVLKGTVWNIEWGIDETGDEFYMSTLRTGSDIGTYTHDARSKMVERFRPFPARHGEGETYSMEHNQIHSIEFERDTYVLFFEGPKKTDETTVLEPYVDGARIPTFKVDPWMFLKGNTQ